MKKLRFSTNKVLYLLLVVWFFPMSVCFSQWQWLNPLPQGNTLRNIQFVNESTGYEVGDGGTVLKTSNAGLTWERMNTNSISNFYGVHFITEEIGYACGTNEDPAYYLQGVVIKTTNGGESWTRTPEIGIYTEVYSVFFTSPDTGYLAGYNYAFKTTDGGESWFEIQPEYADFSTVYFTNSLTGYLIGGNKIYKTIDAGYTWNPYSFNMLFPNSLSFVNSDTGYVCGVLVPGFEGKISKTVDAGENWTTLPYTSEKWIGEICFINADTGFVTGDSGFIIKTVDGGLTWTGLSSGTSDWLAAIGFASDNTGAAVGKFGVTIHTIDLGENWQVISSNVTTNYLSGSHFTTQETGYIVGMNGTILKSSNAGDTWDLLPKITNKGLYDVTFTDNNTGYACGEYGIILKTIDTGNNWDSLNTNSKQFLHKLSFISPQIGFALSGKCLLKTSNAGINWDSISFPQYLYANSFSFIDDYLGYVGGLNGKLIQTEDGGMSWNFLNTGTTDDIYCVYFINKNIGFFSSYSGIKKTSDGGINWETKYSETGGSDLFFIDSLSGFAIASQNLLITKDCGETWNKFPVNQTNYNFGDVYFTSIDTGYLVGMNGLILKTTCGGVITSARPENDISSERLKHLIIIPNPNKGQFQINLPSILQSGVIEVYSITGEMVYQKEISKTVQTQNISLSHNIANGIYCILLRSENNIYTGKVFIRD